MQTSDTYMRKLGEETHLYVTLRTCRLICIETGKIGTHIRTLSNWKHILPCANAWESNELLFFSFSYTFLCSIAFTINVGISKLIRRTLILYLELAYRNDCATLLYHLHLLSKSGWSIFNCMNDFSTVPFDAYARRFIN